MIISRKCVGAEGGGEVVTLLPKKEEESLKTLSATDITKAHCALEPAPEERAPKFLEWEKVLHPSQPVVATGEIPQPTKASRPKVGSSQLSRMIPIKPPASPLRTPTPHKPSSPVQALALMWPPTLLHGSWDFQCEYQLHCEGLGYRCNIYRHHHYLHWEGGPEWSRSGSLLHRSYN